MLLFLVLVGAALLIDELSAAAKRETSSELRTARALEDAKAALIGFATANPYVPGLLPFPDRNSDGNYDGNSDCPPVTVVTDDTHLLGHLPWQGKHGPCVGNPAAMGDLRDAAGAPLWYGVSKNLVRYSDGATFADPPVNPDWDDAAPAPWITVRDHDGSVLSDRVAFLIIAPGEPLQGQDRSTAAPSVENYLDSVTVAGLTYSNADFDQDFITYPDSRHTPDPNDSFNDRIVYVTVDELLPLVEHRVIGTVARALAVYESAHGTYPWLSAFGDTDFRGAGGVREGHVPFHSTTPVTYRTFATRMDASWSLQNADVTASGTVDPADVAAGTVSVGASSGTCEWRAPDEVDCTATRMQSLSPPVERTYRFTFGEGSVTTDDPTASDVRRRTVSLADPLDPSAADVISVVDTNTDTAAQTGAGSLRIDADTTGTLAVGGIHYDLAVPEELPQWFVDSRWHEFVYVGLSEGYVPGAPADCGGLNPPCLTLLNWYPPQDDKWALVLSAGSELAAQDRGTGTLASYFEGENGTAGDDTFERANASATFNDQVRIVAP
ncbi:MAG: hypothetical protein GWN84_01775 [Gammaproteobacteria bacterium]|nr:hypothetical protein [Gammaproteobacteria bacterium]NIR81890.1 hypothetical protein [Gammaproteobacteria bacterium]NIR88722.1 hypothetical protein [Gammaproteobacteria bacterium]NIU02998.1 hypothetical protein [Gammaproteobacteria bacterium]NIV50519.1 hypothetical protein [Gammaproteobacteria bacterium]